MKTCSKCGIEKSIDSFSIKNKKTGNRSSWCRSCNREYQKEHYQKNKTKYREKARSWEKSNGGSLGKRIRNYSLSLDKYKSLLDKFDGKCWICKKKQATHIDHDHSCCPGTKSCGLCVRGLLCITCNSNLSWIESVGHQSIQDYLKK